MNAMTRKRSEKRKPVALSDYGPPEQWGPDCVLENADVHLGVMRRRTLDVVEKMHRDDPQSVTVDMLLASKRFAEKFEAACLRERYAAMGWHRVDKSAASTGMPPHIVRAREWVAAVKADCARRSYAALEAVCGRGMTIKGTAEEFNWIGVPATRDMVKAFLLAALEIVADRHP